MKQRIISSVAGLFILALVISLFDTVALNTAVAIIIVLSLYELFSAAGQLKLPITPVAIVFGAVIPFFSTSLLSKILPAVCFIFALLLFCLMIKHHKTVSAEEIGFVFFFTISIAMATSCFVYMRDILGRAVGLYAVVVTLCGAWMNDTGAYFTGVFLGKHKLAPEISPNKTVEGFFGGIIVSVISQLIAGFLYTQACAFYGVTVDINYLALAIVSPFIAVVSVVGDLSASVMKRQFGIKDFGNIMPGHGGVLDRFDSVYLCAVLVYNLFRFSPLITVK